MADSKKLPDDAYATIESEDNSSRKKDVAKKELEATDTTGRKAKAIVADAVAGLGKVIPGYSILPSFRDREFGKDTKEHSEKVKRLKEEAGMKKGGIVSASKRADGCAMRGKTKGRMV